MESVVDAVGDGGEGAEVEKEECEEVEKLGFVKGGDLGILVHRKESTAIVGGSCRRSS